MVTIGIMLRYLHGFQLFQAGFLLNLVVTFVGIVFQMPHISNVADVAHLVTKMLEITEKDVKSNRRTGMS